MFEPYNGRTAVAKHCVKSHNPSDPDLPEMATISNLTNRFIRVSDAAFGSLCVVVLIKY